MLSFLILSIFIVMGKKRLVAFLLFLMLLVQLVFPVVSLAQEPPANPPATAVGTDISPGQEAWMFDAKTTEIGKRAERARQFINWVLTHPSIDNHPVFRQVWLISAVTTLLLIVVTVAVMGVGLIIAKKQDISVKVDVVPILTKAAVLLIYALSSYWLVLGLVQISDILMTFFIKLLNADKLFSIFFAGDTDTGYRQFVGFRNFDPLANESAKTSHFLIDFSSYTYFAMGIMILLREIVLWFLLIVAPFLALLMPFRLIRNIGWIWIGVFFQWAFYGPLFALFLGALTKIWEAGIPFPFNFARIATEDGVVYPLAINILYGGPQQIEGGLGMVLSHQNPINTSSYIDTFAEYVISLLMLWMVIILPWWLLRIFRDYCCDGIYAMKNILMNMLNQQRTPEPPTGPSSSVPTNLGDKFKTARPQTSQSSVTSSMKMKNIENIKNIKTEEISKKMDLSVSKVSDIARFETQKNKSEYARKVMDYMKNPMSAGARDEQTQFIKIKTELSQRANQGDMEAKRLLEATSASPLTMRSKIQELARQRPAVISTMQSVSIKTNVSEENVRNITTSITEKITKSKEVVQQIANRVQISETQAENVIRSVPKTIQEGNIKNAVKQVSTEAGIEESKTSSVYKETAEAATKDEVIKQVAKEQNKEEKQVKEVAEEVFENINQTDQQVAESTVQNAQSVSIEEYEQIRQMWVEHYTKGEVPVSEDIKNRKDWIAKEQIKLDNVLNKIVSENEEIRAEGLKEVAEIIPFFVLGNMSIQEIATYLKAKLSSAKEVAKNMETEEQIKDKLEKKADEEFVTVPTKKEEKPKTLKLEKELKDESNKSQGVSNNDEVPADPLKKDENY